MIGRRPTGARYIAVHDRTRAPLRWHPEPELIAMATRPRGPAMERLGAGHMGRGPGLPTTRRPTTMGDPAPVRDAPCLVLRGAGAAPPRRPPRPRHRRRSSRRSATGSPGTDERAAPAPVRLFPPPPCPFDDGELLAQMTTRASERLARRPRSHVPWRRRSSAGCAIWLATTPARRLLTSGGVMATSWA